MSESQIDPLAQMLISGVNRKTTAYALAAIGAEALSSLTNLTAHAIEDVRLNALRAIHYQHFRLKSGGPTVPALVRALEDVSPKVRAEAAIALTVVCEQPELAVSALQKSLKDPESNVRLFSVRALGRYQAAAAMDDLLPLLDDAETPVRAAAAYSLGQMTNHTATVVTAMAKAVADTKAEVRHSAISGLGNMGSHAKAALPFLVKALNDDFPHVSGAAAAAIKKIDPDEARRLEIP